MELLRSFLKAMFVDVPYWQATQSFVGKESIFSGNDAMMSYARSVVAYAREKMPYLNDDKQQLMTRLFCDEWAFSPESRSVHGSPNILYALIHEVNSLLVVKDGSPAVRLDSILRWRMISLDLGDDVLIAAFLAFRDRHAAGPSNCHMVTSVGVEDADLNYLFNQGLSDLHQHLKASSDTFTISWLCLMNHISGRSKEFKKLRDVDNSLYSECYDAARIRLELFKLLFLGGRREENSRLTNRPLLLDKALNELQNEINIHVALYAKDVLGSKIDYAISVPPFVADCYDIHRGEISVLYRAFKEVYANPGDARLTMLLYRYLIARTHLRKALVQNNNMVGFGNFMRYENLKELLLDKYPAYKKLMIKIPYIEARQHHVSYIETRIAPKKCYMDLKKAFADTIKSCREVQKLLQMQLQDVGIIYHFIKEADPCYKKGSIRNSKLRRLLKRQSIDMMKLRSHNQHAAQYFVGVDAANTELDCRPEVFAQSFRYLRHKGCLNPNVNHDSNTFCQSVHFTYHVGEDFYDMVDGLRAIDEAITFLHLGSGDRLGHCLALGTNAKVFYDKQHCTIPITRQCLIDNCVWMLMKARSLNIKLTPQLEQFLHMTFLQIGGVVYPADLLNVEVYYMSMMLRGDNPSKNEENVLNYIEDWQSFEFDSDALISQYRKNKVAQGLYQMYHYDETVRVQSDKVVSFVVPKFYIEAVSEIQNSMMMEIEAKGLILECCPSSNWKIGMIDRYDEHPIFRFKTITDKEDGFNLPVTINTDDLGIFQTSLDYEYALLAAAALKKKNANGDKLYTKAEVIRWLEDIRRNGEKYKFKNQCPERGYEHTR